MKGKIKLLIYKQYLYQCRNINLFSFDRIIVHFLLNLETEVRWRMLLDLLMLTCFFTVLIILLETALFLFEDFRTKAFIMSLNSYFDIYPSLFLSNYFSKLLYYYSETLVPIFSLISWTVSFPLLSVSIKLNARSMFYSVTTIYILDADVTNYE